MNLEEKIAYLAEEYKLAGEAIFDVNAGGEDEIMQSSVYEALKESFATGYSLGALSILQQTFTKEGEESKIITIDCGKNF